MSVNNNGDKIKSVKIFVGNVPFKCTQEEFNKCFENINGFIDGKIINRYNNSLVSRGFGFITMKSKDDADKLMNKTDVILKNRVLRFSNYNFNTKNEDNSLIKKNYLFIRNIPKNIKREQIKEIFENYGTVGACFINTNIKTGESKESAVVEIKEDNIYENLIKQQTINNKFGKPFEIIRWKNKIKFKSNNYKYQKYKANPEEIYRLAFNAGVNVGRLEGIRLSKNNNY